MKSIIAFIVSIALAPALLGQSSFPYDSASREVVYMQSFKLNPKIKTEDVYAIAQKWFDDPAKFNQKNAEPPVDTTKAKKRKRQLEVYEHYANPRPLQTLDPNANKMLGMGMMRYYSGTNNSIKLLYLKYDISIEIKAGMAVMSILRIHYFHYNPANYNEAPLFGFSKGKPCDAVGTIEQLIACENFHEEFQNLATYYNKQVNGLFADFKNTLRLKKALYEPKAPASVATTKNAKPTAKRVSAPKAAK